MNYIALNQTIFKKFGVIGQGFRGGDRKAPGHTRRGYDVWINGVHEMPEISEISDYYEIGSLEYPDLMIGMGDGSGEIKYWLGVSEKEYALVIGVKLHEDPSDDHAFDLAAFVRKDSIPPGRSEEVVYLNDVADELLIAHFTHFLGTDNIDEFKPCIEDTESDILKKAFEYYEQNAAEEVKQTLSDDPGT
ncbi:MAG: hypothetical protein LW630_07560 [Saprospiraceae bacterium]|nr:hypothetical protein [Saprospiraceae bacterium]